MHIEQLTSLKNDKYVKVVLSYDEVRDIANGLYYLTSDNKTDVGKYKEIAAKTHFLFDMVKHGNIQPNTIKKLADILK